MTEEINDALLEESETNQNGESAQLLENIYQSFLDSVHEADGEATLKDAFFNGVYAALITMKHSFESSEGDLNVITESIIDCDVYLQEMYAEGSIDLSFLEVDDDDDVVEDDFEYDDEEFDEDDEESTVEKD